MRFYYPREGRCLLRAVAASLFFLGLPIAGAADDAPGIEVGKKAPAFELSDQDGKQRSLDELLKNGKVALVFYRSANWWPFCKRQLVQLQQDLQKIQATGTQVVGISYDSVKVLRGFAGQRKITFPLLSDPRSKVIDAYGVRNKQARGQQEGIPHPTTFLIDQQGKVQAKLPGTVRRRHTTELLVKAAKGGG